MRPAISEVSFKSTKVTIYISSYSPGHEEFKIFVCVYSPRVRVSHAFVYNVVGVK